MMTIRMMLHFCLLVFPGILLAQDNYSNLAAQASRLTALTIKYPQLAKLNSLTKTSGGKDIWQLTIGNGNTDAKPALVVVGGTEGHYILGTELAIGFAENLLQSSG